MKKPTETLLRNYTPPAFLVDHVDLNIDIRDDHARVTSHLNIRRNPAHKKKNAPLILDGEHQRILGVVLNGHLLSSKQYQLTPHTLTIHNVPPTATLDIASTHNPYTNTSLAGLYAAGPMLNTQCEAEGFRRITYYPDRPDVMAKFRVTITADRAKYPVLLANGNLVSKGTKPNGRHFTVWEDPFPKPCYLFAIVAGKLDKVSDKFVTKSGRKVLIEIYVEPGKGNETVFARTALKKSMRWDEQRFGLEYDLDRFMIVATPFFNMGAMENKGLNIFNDACVLGRVETATDATISFIERVVAHEYFHNWTGNRITCRDWFQLSLKEGLTVFREQEYMGDSHSVAVERLETVRDLRRAQFAEDAGAMAHPVRPDHYQAIDNFYTATVYDKGSEVVRMIQTLVGMNGFNRGMKLYVKRHDGQAVTCDDFVRAIADANKENLTQFMRWYQQAGTPTVKATSRYDEKTKTLRLTLNQKTPATPGQKTKLPLHIPFAVGMLDAKGHEIRKTEILHLTKPSQEFIFRNLKSKPVLSLLRDFSAPIRLNYAQSDDELLFLLAHDTDGFNRWESSVKLLTKYLLALADGKKIAPKVLDNLMEALGNVLNDPKIDAAFKAMTLSLPSEGELGLTLNAAGKKINPDILIAARKIMVGYIAKALHNDFAIQHAKLANLSITATDGVSMGKRSLKNLCMHYLAFHNDPKILQTVFKQATTSKNMTDRIAALGTLIDKDTPLRAKALAQFGRDWRDTPTVMDKWLALQAGAKRASALQDVQKLLKHKAFDMKNPNRVSALIGSFAGNIVAFHAKNGSGYKFIADMIIAVDPINAHKGSALAKAFARWRDYEPKRQTLMQRELKRLARHKTLSPNTREIVEKSLKA
jgi:aminopeptidase N